MLRYLRISHGRLKTSLTWILRRYIPSLLFMAAIHGTLFEWMNSLCWILFDTIYLLYFCVLIWFGFGLGGLFCFRKGTIYTTAYQFIWRPCKLPICLRGWSRDVEFMLFVFNQLNCNMTITYGNGIFFYRPQSKGLAELTSFSVLDYIILLC